MRSLSGSAFERHTHEITPQPLRVLTTGLAAGLALTLVVRVRRPRRGRRRPDSGAEDGTTVKVGYLHTIAVDDKLWLGQVDGPVGRPRARPRDRPSSPPASS